MDTSVGDLFERVDWEAVVEKVPIATLVVDAAEGTVGQGDRTVIANAAARSLLGLSRCQSLAAVSPLRLVDLSVTSPVRQTVHSLETLTGNDGGDVHLSSVGGRRAAYTMLVQAAPDGVTLVQFAPCAAQSEIERVLDQQQRFRAALVELSQLAFETTDDDEFYQRLIERAVEVVPGAQGGSVQLNIPGTAKFRFVAAVGYDLEGLKAHDLEQAHFFRDAWNPIAQIVRNFDAEGRSPEITEWLETVGRLSDIVVNVSAPVLSGGFPVAFLSLDNFEDPDAISETSVEMTTVLGSLIGELWRRRELEAELRKEREAYRHLAMHDPLTGLANRRNLEKRLGENLAAASKRGFPSAVLFLDVDDFKGVNDRLGHDIGDRLLQRVAEGACRAVRAGDVVGRWGGDEFLLLPHRVDSVNEVMALAERVLLQFEDEADLGDGLRHRVRITVGAGWSADSAADPEALVRAADEALYEAKSAGKGVARLKKV